MHLLKKLNQDVRGRALLSPKRGFPRPAVKAAGRAGASQAPATVPPPACPFPGHLPTAPGGKARQVRGGLLEATKKTSGAER